MVWRDSMSYKFYFEDHSNDSQSKLYLVKRGDILPQKINVELDQWASEINTEALTALNALRDLEGAVIAERNDALILDDEIVAGLSSDYREFLNIPLPPPNTLKIVKQGNITDEDFTVTTQWLNDNMISVAGNRIGKAKISFGTTQYLLDKERLAILSEIETYAGETNTLIQTARLFEVLQTSEHIQIPALMNEMYLCYSNAFAIEPIQSETNSIDFDISPMRRIKSERNDEITYTDQRALPSSRLQRFRDQINNTDEIKNKYLVGDNNQSYILLFDEKVQKAVTKANAVRRSGNNDEKRNFLLAPHAYLNASSEDSDNDFDFGELFIETSAYSEWVTGIGKYEREVLPWIKATPNPWIPEVAGCGVVVNGEHIPLNPDNLDIELERIQEARASGQTHIELGESGKRIEISDQLVDSISRLIRVKHTGEQINNDVIANEQYILLVDNNYQETRFAVQVERRLEDNSLPSNPSKLTSTLKDHQRVCFNWLAESYEKGAPGVLLADDMGLGKTLESLAFHAALMEHKPDSRVLIVAPTALIRNWQDEMEIHFRENAFGRVLALNGNRLKQFKQHEGNDISTNRAVLDPAIADYNVLLTTYETLRDYQQSFGAIKFDLAIFDEAQKIKTPNVAITLAAKAMNIDFCLAMTGTPIENRLADIWSIIDRAHPGYLEDLRTFSDRFERRADDEEALSELNNLLTSTRENNSVPQIMMRRMKTDHLRGLPRKTIQKIPTEMPKIQADAYDQIYSMALTQEAPGAKLQAISMLRSCSLHPVRADTVQYSSDYISQSARLSATVDLLGEIQARNEKVLVFIEDRAFQEKFKVMLQTEFHVNNPLVINGTVSGETRQKRVKEFNDERVGFDVMIISPKAGGVGLTLTSANNVIHLSRWWNPAVEDQCTDRVFRIGQDRDVNVYIPLAIHPNLGENSFDQILDALIERKRTMGSRVYLPVNKGQDTEELFSGIRGDNTATSGPSILGLCDQSDGINFEEIIKNHLNDNGFVARATGHTDGGIDIVVTGNCNYLIQCKYAEDPQNSTGRNKVQQVINGVRAYPQVENPKLVVVSNSASYDRSAVNLAAEHDVLLIARDQIDELPSLL